MLHLETRQDRLGFTLIELLVVITIISLIAALGYLFFPSFSSRTMVDAADRVQGVLLLTKQQARRDGRPTGVRLVVTSGTFVNTLQMIQQPDDFTPAGGTCLSAGTPSVTFQLPAGTTLLGNGSFGCEQCG